VEDLFLKPNDIVRVHPRPQADEALLRKLEERYAQLEAAMIDRSHTLGPQHVEVVKLRRELDATKLRIAELRRGAGGASTTTDSTAP
jgi:uncharacterized protein involved in exopolysaccharide biosynthesis